MLGEKIDKQRDIELEGYEYVGTRRVRDEELFDSESRMVKGLFLPYMARYHEGLYYIQFPSANEYESDCEVFKEKGDNRMKVKLDYGAFMPTRAHDTDAGLDIKSPKAVTIYAHDSAVIDTGVHIAIPKGYVGMLKSKSGLNVKHGITSEGVIDAGYTGSIRVKLYNNSSEIYTVVRGDKITQLVILPILTPDLELVDSLEETERGDGGFGSTGK